MLLLSQSGVLSGLICNAYRVELADILIIKNVNKHQHFEACLHFLASKCFLTEVRLSYESNQLDN